MCRLSRGGVEVDSSVVGQPGDPLGHQHRWASAHASSVREDHSQAIAGSGLWRIERFST
jgi:hypothetical protein